MSDTSLFETLVKAKTIREDQTATINELRMLLAKARDKLALYRADHSGEYVGGTEYTELMRQIDAALAE